VCQQIKDMLRQEIIQPSKSPWGTPAILVRRKDLHGKPQPPRFVVDYRALNSVTKSDGIPLPQVIDILDWLGGGKAFAKLDLAKGYGLVPVGEEDREKNNCSHSLWIIRVHLHAHWSQDGRSYLPKAYASHIF